MKKIMLTAGLIWIAASAVSQTTSPYIFFKPVYAFNTASEQVAQSNSFVNGQVFTKGIYGSYANGFGLNAGIGKMINSTFGVEIGAQFMWGKNYSYSDENGNTASGHVNAATINPMLVIRTSGDLLAVYGKMGLSVITYANSFFNASVRQDSVGAPILATTKGEENIKAKVGFAAAFGLSFRVSEAVALFGEVNGQLMSLPVYKGHYTQFEANGVDILPKLDPRQKEWVYEKSGFLTSGSPDKPEVRLYDPPNFSYIGISIGLNFYF